MKKVFMLLAVCASVIFADAQTTVRGSKFTDNWSVGVQAGGVTRTYGHKFFGDLRPVVGLTVAKEITPVFGLAAEFNAAINAQHNNFGPTGAPCNTHKAFDASNLSGLLRVNLVNLIKDYTGEPGFVDVKAVFGFGWGHEYYGHRYNDRNLLTSKAGLDFGFNIGADKAWQVNVKPAYIWALTDGARASEYDNKFAHLELTAGVTYKFKNSNGTHNFVLVKEYDQAEVDGLNAKINDLRNQLGAKDQKIAADAAAIKKLQDELNECRNKKVPTPPVVDPGKTVNQLETNVFFAQGKSLITAAQQPNVERVASFLKSHPAAKVAIKGYASPEGGKAINDKLSKARAEAVKTMLVKKYKVDASRIVSVEGCGVGDLFSEPTWNRVAVSTLSE